MDETIAAVFSSLGRHQKVGFWLLLCCVLYFSFPSSSSFSVNRNFRRKYPVTTNARPRFNEGICRTTFPRAADQCVKEDISPKRIDTSLSSVSPTTTHIVFPGGGVFFYHQAGMVNFLRERYDLSACTFAGASAGALTATLAAADVDFYEATDLAMKMAADAGVWDRSGGLQGIWGPIIEAWLDALLPASIDTVQDRITLLVTPLPFFGKSKISRFENRQDLIQCNLASVHLPWFLDGKLTNNFRGRPHIDGSFLAKEDDYSRELEFRPVDTIILDWTKDPEMSSKGGLGIVETLSVEGIYGLLEQGKRYAEVLEEQGVFDNLIKLE